MMDWSHPEYEPARVRTKPMAIFVFSAVLQLALRNSVKKTDGSC